MKLHTLHLAVLGGPFSIAFGIVVAMVGAGCVIDAGGDTDGDEARVGAAASAIINFNSLSPAALSATATYPGALTEALLAGKALAPGELGGAALAAITDPGAAGKLSRSLLRYTVGCALDATGAFSFSWTDSSGAEHVESYPGLIGLATDWAAGPLGATEQAWISACVISRVNYFGVEVALSSRGSAAALACSGDEIADYTYQEGAFWGDLFAATPTAYACDDPANAAHSVSADRVCATGYVADGGVADCGIVQPLGDCAAVCAALDGGGSGYYPNCTAAGGSTAQVLTVFLQ